MFYTCRSDSLWNHRKIIRTNFSEYKTIYLLLALPYSGGEELGFTGEKERDIQMDKHT